MLYYVMCTDMCIDTSISFAECPTLRNPKAAGFVENGGFEGVFLRQQVLEGRLPHDEATARLAYRQIYSFIAPHIRTEQKKV